MSIKRFRQAVRQLGDGVRFFAKYPSDPQPAVLRVEWHADANFYRGIVFKADGKSVLEIWDASRMHTIRKIATGYFPQLSRAFGPARLYVGI